jgi:DNA-binding transcriptional MerR regulator
MPSATRRIGSVAAEAGVHVQTLRYYERRGLLPRAARTASGYRDYAPDTAQVVRFIKRAQELGFTLNEVQELLRLRSSPARDRERVRKIATTKMAAIDDKVAQLQAVRQALAGLVKCCESGVNSLRCDIMEALDGECDSALVTLRVGRARK